MVSSMLMVGIKNHSIFAFSSFVVRKAIRDHGESRFPQRQSCHSSICRVIMSPSSLHVGSSVSYPCRVERLYLQGCYVEDVRVNK